MYQFVLTVALPKQPIHQFKPVQGSEKQTTCTKTRYRPRFFDQVGHQTTYTSMGNKHFIGKECHRQTCQNYEQSRQKLGTFLVNKVL